MSIQEPNAWFIQPSKALVTLEVHPDKMKFSLSEDHHHLKMMVRYKDPYFHFN